MTRFTYSGSTNSERLLNNREALSDFADSSVAEVAFLLAALAVLPHDRVTVNAEPMVTIILEINGNDRLVLPPDPSRTEADLLQLVQEEAERCAVPLSDVNLRFVVAAESSEPLSAIGLNAA